jgi:NitT/TauT family transport system substrate-binding protein
MKMAETLRSRILAAIVALMIHGATAAESEPLNIRVGWTNTPATLSPLLFQNTAILRHYGTSYVVELRRFTGSTPLLAALKAGDLDIGAVSFSNVGAAVIKQGMADFRIVADGNQGGIEGYASVEFYVRNNSGIKTVADLKGKTVASNAAGGASDFGLRAMLHKQGFENGRDYTLVHAPYPQLGGMLLDGKVDLASLPAPFTYEPKFKAGAHILFTVKDALGPTQQLVTASRRGFLEANRPAVQDFFEDYLIALRWLLDPANRGAAIKILADVTKLPEQRFAGWAFTKDDFYHDPQGRPNIPALKRNLAALKDIGLMPVALDPEPYVDLSLITEAARRLK